MEQETMSKDKSEQQRHCQTSESQGRRDEGYTTGFKHRLDAWLRCWQARPRSFINCRRSLHVCLLAYFARNPWPSWEETKVTKHKKKLFLAMNFCLGGCLSSAVWIPSLLCEKSSKGATQPFSDRILRLAVKDHVCQGQQAWSRNPRLLIFIPPHTHYR